jgi:branched-chain amino acid transport system substrate-binding protein
MLRVRWLALLSCLFAVSALTVSACGDDDDDGGGGGGGGGGTVDIYSSLPLQGASRPQTTAMVEGIKLAVEQAGGKAGDFKIKYTSLDDSTAQAGTWTPEAASANARKVAQDDSAVAYIGEFNSGASAISIPILNEVPIAQISPANTAVGLTSDEPGADAGEP